MRSMLSVPTHGIRHTWYNEHRPCFAVVGYSATRSYIIMSAESRQH